MRVLELYCGIGGCAAALSGRAEVAIVAAVDINRKALGVYSHNFRHSVAARTLESVPADDFRRWNADLWWLSPPCQPFTSRGRQRDLADPRTVSFLALLERIAELRPHSLAMENVPGFETSQAHQRLIETLIAGGYRWRERLLCPTELGVPNRRRRFYLVASQDELRPWPPVGIAKPLAVRDVLDDVVDPQLFVAPELADKYAAAWHLVHARDPDEVTHCFTSAYGRSPVRSGSLLRTESGIRRFSPTEILRLLGFPAWYQLPPLAPRDAWPLVGNSLSVTAVQYVLSVLPALA